MTHNVEGSFARVFAQKAELAVRFYEHLFRLAPEVEALFHKEMFVQREMFSYILVLVARHIYQPDKMSDIADRLAQMHRGTNVSAKQFALAEQALFAAFEEVFDDELSAEEWRDWQAAIRVLVSRMASGVEV